MCGGGGFGQYVVSFWIAESKNRQWSDLNVDKFHRQLLTISGVQEVYFEQGGKVTLLCIPGRTDGEILRRSIINLGYTVIR